MPFKSTPPLYSVWQSMRNRCNNPNHKQWRDYGGRGIKICSRWNDFHAFVDDMGPRPEGCQIDRIDVDGDYEPSNCRWVDRKTQQRNQRRTHKVTIDGVEYLAIDLAEIAGTKSEVILKRVARGLPFEEVIAPSRGREETLKLARQLSRKTLQAKTHCPKGHEYTSQNTILSRQGWRRCRACFYEKERRRRVNKP